MALIKNDTNKKYTVIAKSLQHSLIIAQNNKYCRQIWKLLVNENSNLPAIQICVNLNLHASVSAGHKQARPAGTVLALLN